MNYTVKHCWKLEHRPVTPTNRQMSQNPKPQKTKTNQHPHYEGYLIS